MTVEFWLAFPLGYFWHLKIFAGTYETLEMYRPDVIIPLGLTSMVVQGLFCAWAFPRLFDTQATRWLVNAFGFFAVFGTLAFSFVVLPVAAKYRMTDVARFMRLETAFTALQFAITGLLIARPGLSRGAVGLALPR